MSNRIRLINATQDSKRVAEIYEPFCIGTPVTFETAPPDATEMAARIARIVQTNPWLVFESQQRLVAYAYAGPHRARRAYQWSVEVSIYVDQAHHRQGIARPLYTSLFAILKRQGYVNAYAGITLPNVASVGVHESLGFKQVGVYQNVGFKLGKWHDVGWWAKPLADRPANPVDPVSIDQIVTCPEWNSLLNSGLTQLNPDAGAPRKCSGAPATLDPAFDTQSPDQPN